MQRTHTKYRRLTPRQIERIQTSELSLRTVARELGVGKSTVSYHRQKLLRENERADGWDDTDDENDLATIDFQRLPTPQRCPVHGLLHVWPCVICSTTKQSRYE
jgi:hypothetical protein